MKARYQIGPIRTSTVAANAKKKDQVENDVTPVTVREARGEHCDRVPGTRVVGKARVGIARHHSLVASHLILKFANNVGTRFVGVETGQWTNTGRHIGDDFGLRSVRIVRNGVHDARTFIGVQYLADAIENNLVDVASRRAAVFFHCRSEILPVALLFHEHANTHETDQDSENRKAGQVKVGFYRQEHN